MDQRLMWLRQSYHALLIVESIEIASVDYCFEHYYETFDPVNLPNSNAVLPVLRTPSLVKANKPNI